MQAPRNLGNGGAGVASVASVAFVANVAVVTSGSNEVGVCPPRAQTLLAGRYLVGWAQRGPVCVDLKWR